jgi:hypothetical protein
MPNTILTIGPVVLQRFEVPDQINIGGKQRLAVHQLTDGRRVIDSLGRDDSNISFRGIFSGSDATMRARLLDVLRVAGEPLPLTWDVFFYTVILSDFQASYERNAWIPYRITCTVLRDEAASSIPVVVSLANIILSDINAAATSASGTSLNFTSLLESLTAVGATTQDTSAHGSAISDLTTMQLSVDAQVVAEETSIQANATSPSTSTQAALQSLSVATQSTQQLAGLTAARGYLGRAAINLNNAST